MVWAEEAVRSVEMLARLPHCRSLVDRCTGSRAGAAGALGRPAMADDGCGLIIIWRHSFWKGKGSLAALDGDTSGSWNWVNHESYEKCRQESGD